VKTYDSPAAVISDGGSVDKVARQDQARVGLRLSSSLRDHTPRTGDNRLQLKTPDRRKGNRDANGKNIEKIFV
jgi:hypothetical protein